MDWTAIILGLFSGTTVLGIFEAIRYRRENKKIKNSEATQSQVEAQKAEIDLANKYRDEMLNMVQMVKEANEKNFSNQDQIIDHLAKLDAKLENIDARVGVIETRVGNIETRVGDIEEYLNGEYQQHLAKKKNKQVRNEPRKKKQASSNQQEKK